MLKVKIYALMNWKSKNLDTSTTVFRYWYFYLIAFSIEVGLNRSGRRQCLRILTCTSESERERKYNIIFSIYSLAFIFATRSRLIAALLNVNGASPVNYYSWFLIFVWWPT